MRGVGEDPRSAGPQVQCLTCLGPASTSRPTRWMAPPALATKSGRRRSRAGPARVRLRSASWLLAAPATTAHGSVGPPGVERHRWHRAPARRSGSGSPRRGHDPGASAPPRSARSTSATSGCAASAASSATRAPTAPALHEDPEPGHPPFPSSPARPARRRRTPRPWRAHPNPGRPSRATAEGERCLRRTSMSAERCRCPGRWCRCRRAAPPRRDAGSAASGRHAAGRGQGDQTSRRPSAGRRPPSSSSCRRVASSTASPTLG